MPCVIWGLSWGCFCLHPSGSPTSGLPPPFGHVKDWARCDQTTPNSHSRPQSLFLVKRCFILVQYPKVSLRQFAQYFSVALCAKTPRFNAAWHTEGTNPHKNVPLSPATFSLVLWCPAHPPKPTPAIHSKYHSRYVVVPAHLPLAYTEFTGHLRTSWTRNRTPRPRFSGHSPCGADRNKKQQPGLI